MRLPKIIPADDFHPLWLERPNFLPTIKPQFIARPKPILVVAREVCVEPRGDRHHVWEASQRHVIRCVCIGSRANYPLSMPPNLITSQHQTLRVGNKRDRLLNSPSATPLSKAGPAPMDDQSGTKKHPVSLLISTQSAAEPGPSKVDTNGFPL